MTDELFTQPEAREKVGKFVPGRITGGFGYNGNSGETFPCDIHPPSVTITGMARPI
jgi:hypothetical protein